MSTPLEQMVQWITTLEKTARDLLARRADLHDPGAYRLRGRICREHFHCIAVTGVSPVEHFPWQDTDPVELAGALLNRVLPPHHPGGSGETGGAA